MALWNSNNVVVTQKGYELLSKLQNGDSTMIITRVVTGSGRVSPSLLYKQTQVTNIKQEMQILKKVASEKGSTLELQVSNESLREGYSLNQIGVYASNPDMGEILYMIAQSEEPADFIPLPSGTPTLLNFSLEVVHSKQASLNVNISNTGLQPSYEPSLRTKSKLVSEAINEVWDRSSKFFSLFSELPLVGSNDTIYIVYGDIANKNGQYMWRDNQYNLIVDTYKIDTHLTDFDNPHKVTAKQVKMVNGEDVEVTLAKLKDYLNYMPIDGGDFTDGNDPNSPNIDGGTF